MWHANTTSLKLVLLTLVVVSGLEVILPVQNAANYTHANYWRMDFQEWSQFEGQLVDADSSGGDISGNVALREDSNAFTAKIANDLINQGAAAIVFIDDFSDTPGLFGENLNARVPIVGVGRTVGKALKDIIAANNQTFIRVSHAEGKNGFLDVCEYTVWIWAVLAFLVYVDTCLACWRLYQFVKRFGFEVSIAQICLSLEILAGILRFIFFAIDPPLYCRNIFHRMASQILLTGTMPISLATTLLITFFWYELMSKAKVKRTMPMLVKFKFPYITIIVFLIILDLAHSVIRGLQLSVRLLAVLQTGAYLLTTLLVTMFFFFCAFRIFRRLNKARKLTSSKSRKVLYKTTILILGSGVGNIVLIVSSCLPLTNFFTTPVGFQLTWLLVYSSLIAVSTTQILAFSVPARDRRNSVQKRPRTPKTSSSSRKSTPTVVELSALEEV